MCWSDRDEPAIAVSDDERDESDFDMPLRSSNRSGCALSGTLNGDSEHDTPCSNKGKSRDATPDISSSNPGRAMLCKKSDEPKDAEYKGKQNRSRARDATKRQQ